VRHKRWEYPYPNGPALEDLVQIMRREASPVIEQGIRDEAAGTGGTEAPAWATRSDRCRSSSLAPTPE
jgi:hypothetical protein